MTRKSDTCRSSFPTRLVRSTVLLLLALVVLSTAVFAVTKVWARTVNGSADSTDSANAVALAPNGDLYVVGSLTVTGEGANIWIRKYSSSGTKLWTRTVNGPASGGDYASGAAVDGNGNLYVVDRILTTDEGSNIWIRKYNSSGTKLWTRIVDGPGSGYDSATGAAIDVAGNLYVVGLVTTSGGDEDIWIRKYSSSGAKLWTRNVDGTASGNDRAQGVAVDGTGNLYVVGTIDTTGEQTNIWIRKYSSSGAKLWTRNVDGTASAYDGANGVAVDSNGKVYVVGYVTTTDEGSNIWTRKYNSSGGKLWTRTIDGPGIDFDDADYGNDVALDANGSVYIIGEKGVSGSDPVIVRKYSSSGVKRWTASYTGPVGTAFGKAVAVNSTNRVYAAGMVATSGQGYDIWVRKYRQ